MQVDKGAFFLGHCHFVCLEGTDYALGGLTILIYVDTESDVEFLFTSC